VSELIRLLEHNQVESEVDFSAMEGELSDLIHNKTDIKPTCDSNLDVATTAI
jgi:hypothetical protein